MGKNARAGLIIGSIAFVLLFIVVILTPPIVEGNFFFKLSFNGSNVNETIKIGTLGYCLELSNGTRRCSKLQVGYELDDSLNVNRFIIVPKSVMNSIFMHAVALIVATLPIIFGLIAHRREWADKYHSTYASGLAFIATCIALASDGVIYLAAKKHAHVSALNSAFWLTVVVAILFFLDAIAYLTGRHCFKTRPPKAGDSNPEDRGQAADNGH